MTIEKLLKGLSRTFKGIVLIYFDDYQERLTEAQKNTFPIVVEKDISSFTERLSEDSAYIIVEPKERVKSLEGIVKDFFSRGCKDVFLLVGDSTLPHLKTNELMLSRPSGATIKRLFPVQCLGKSYCVQMASTRYLDESYLERVASEYLFLKLTNKNLQNQKKSLEHKVSEFQGESKKIKENLETLQQEKNSLEVNAKRDADKKIKFLDTEIENLSKEVERLNKEVESSGKEVERLDKEVRVSSKEVERLNKEVAVLGSEKAGLQAEMLYYKEKYKSTKSSLSFRFGNIFVNAGKSPKALLFLPFTLFVFFVKSIKKAVGYRLIKKERKHRTSSFESEEKENLTYVNKILPTRVEAENRKMLSDYLVNSIPTGSWVGIVGERCIKDEKTSDKIIELHPNSWEKLISSNCPDRVIINQAGMDTGPWSSNKDGLAFSYPYHLIELLKHCQSKKIPTEFIGPGISENAKVPKDFLAL